jgi:hypothetical protein
MRDDRGTSLLDELARESRDVVADAHEQWLVLAPRCHREGHVHVDLGDACNPHHAGEAETADTRAARNRLARNRLGGPGVHKGLEVVDSDGAQATAPDDALQADADASSAHEREAAMLRWAFGLRATWR